MGTDGRNYEFDRDRLKEMFHLEIDEEVEQLQVWYDPIFKTWNLYAIIE